MKQIIWILCLVLIGEVLWAQEGKVRMVGTPNGVYVDVKDITFAKQGYWVLRKMERETEFSPVLRVYPAQSDIDVQKRVKDHLYLFPESGVFKDSLAILLWEAWQDPVKQPQFLSLDIPQISIGFGLGFLDTTAVLGKQYTYQIQTEQDGYEGQLLYTLPKTEFAAMETVEIDPGEAFPILRFRSHATDAAPLFEVFRKERGTDTEFKQVYSTRGMNTTEQGDSIIYFIQDTTALQTLRYDYYIQGKDLYGNVGTSSDTVSLQVGGMRNVTRGFNVRTAAVDRGIKIYWEPLEQRYALQNILLYRSDNYDSDFTLLATLPVTDTVYVDQDVRGGKNYYYQLVMQGESTVSFPTARVSGLYTGIVNLLPPTQVSVYMESDFPTLSWQHVDTTNVAGFYIYRSFDSDGALRQISDFIPIEKDSVRFTYRDTSVTIGDVQGYYAVTAVSYTQSLSPLSEVVNLSIPPNVKTKLESPYQLRYIWQDKEQLSITWMDMEQRIAGIDRYEVFRKGATDSVFPDEPIAVVQLNEYVDTLSTAGSYEYAVRLVVGSNTYSALSTPMRVEKIPEKPLAPAKLRLYVADEGDGVILQWDGSYAPMAGYHIYRSSGETPPALLTKLEGEALEYFDNEIKKGITYYYYVTTINMQGTESELSEEVVFIP